MRAFEAILLLKGKEFDVDVCAALGGLADLAYFRLDESAPDYLENKAALEEVFPYFLDRSVSR